MFNPSPSDGVRLITLESQTPGAQTYLAGLAKLVLSSHYLFNPSDNRPIVAMGYSGGFIPLLEAIVSGNYNMNGFVGLGAATAGLSNDKINELIEAVKNITNFASSALFDNLNALFTLGNPIIGSIMQAVANRTADVALDYLKQGIQDLANTLAPKTPDLTATNAQFLVNLWGTNDILDQLGIGGYRASLGGFTPDGVLDSDGNTTQQLFNIEVIGADHFDYMRDSSRPDQAWNLTLSDFVARLIIASQSRDGLIQFLNSRDSGVVLPPHSANNPNDYYIIDLPGHP